jgi:hypothetical protein
VILRDVAPGTYTVEARSEGLWPEWAKTVTLRPVDVVHAKITSFKTLNPTPGQPAELATYVVVLRKASTSPRSLPRRCSCCAQQPLEHPHRGGDCVHAGHPGRRRPASAPLGCGHRMRDGRGNTGADLRAVLHHQGGSGRGRDWASRCSPYSGITSGTTLGRFRTSPRGPGTATISGNRRSDRSSKKASAVLVTLDAARG